MVTRLALLIWLAMLSLNAGGVRASSWPTTISVGTVIDASVGRESGRLRNICSAATTPAGRWAEAMRLTSSTTAGRDEVVSWPTSFGNICSMTAEVGLVEAK